MKEVKKCSISGVAFTMDTDAYQELEAYLESLKKRPTRRLPTEPRSSPNIEARIAELILSAQDSTCVVEKPLILNIIRQMGTAEDISEEEPDEAPKSRASRAVSTATPKTPSWAASAPASASISTSIRSGYGWPCSCRYCSPSSSGFPSCAGPVR